MNKILERVSVLSIAELKKLKDDGFLKLQSAPHLPWPYDKTCEESKRMLVLVCLDSGIWESKCSKLDDQTPKEFYMNSHFSWFHVDIEDKRYYALDDAPQMKCALKKAIEHLSEHPENTVVCQCFGGKSRSVTLASLILMHFRYLEEKTDTSLPPLSLDDIYRLVGTRRHDFHRPMTTGPNSPFYPILQEMEGKSPAKGRVQQQAEMRANEELKALDAKCSKRGKCTTCQKWRCMCK